MTMLLMNVFGGLAIFIFGMKMMSDGLHHVAGERMRTILRIFSSNRLVAVLSGTAVTAVVQSSSASTVMVIGFVNAGLLSLTQAIGIIFGANIGTTVTAQLVAFDISWVIMPAIILGLLASFAAKSTIAGWGETIIGLGFLFLGMEFMSGELKSLSDHPAFAAAFRVFECAPVDGVIPLLPLLGAIATGMVATLIIQSSSACTGIIIALGASGLIDLYTAVALVLGSNIGTTVTAQLAAIPANRIAKQAALAHTLFNVIGVVVITATFWFTIDGVPIFFRLVDWLSADGDLPRRIANAHTAFNVCTTLLLLPCIPLLAKVCEKVLPVRGAKVKYHRLEPLLLDTPEIALTQTVAELRKMLRQAWNLADCALNLRERGNSKKQQVAERLEEKLRRISDRRREITEYLSQLMQRQLTGHQADQVPVLLNCANDADRIGVHSETIRSLMKQIREHKNAFGSETGKELAELHQMLADQARATLTLLDAVDQEKLLTAETIGFRLRTRLNHYESSHLKRVNSRGGIPSGGVVYLELLAELNKISRHLSNITDRMLMLEDRSPLKEGGI